MTKRTWVVVEDNEERVETYVNAFQTRDIDPNYNDTVHVLYFPTKQGKTLFQLLPQLIQNKTKCSGESVINKDELIRAISTLESTDGPLIVLLDICLHSWQGPIQDGDSAATFWSPIAERNGDDLIVIVSTEETDIDPTTVASHKGCRGKGALSSSKPAVRVKTARSIIEAASNEWSDRYELPGKKLLHALMLAGLYGEDNGHITNFAHVAGEFPLYDAFNSDDLKENSFKALFCYATPERVLRDGYHCELGTICRAMLACGLPSSVEDESKKRRGFLPLSPGAVFLVHLCRLVRLLDDDPKVDNPVTQVRLIAKDTRWEMKLGFTKSISSLREKYDKCDKLWSGITVRALMDLRRSCLPITPVNDATLTKTFEKAKAGIPMPSATYVETTVRTKQPCPVVVLENDADVISYNWDNDNCLSIVPNVPAYTLQRRTP